MSEKLLIFAFVLFFACSNKQGIQNSTFKDSIETNIIKDTTDYSKEAVFIDTVFSDSTRLKISSFWQMADPKSSFYFLDSVIVNLSNNNEYQTLIYRDLAIADVLIKQLDRIKDNSGNIYCFIQFYATITPYSFVMIGYRQDKFGFSQIKFDGEIRLFITDCDITTIAHDKIIESCAMRLPAGRETDEELIYTRKSEVEFVLTKTIKK